MSKGKSPILQELTLADRHDSSPQILQQERRRQKSTEVSLESQEAGSDIQRDNILQAQHISYQL